MTRGGERERGDFHPPSRFARSTIPEEKWGTTRSLVLKRCPAYRCPLRDSRLFKMLYWRWHKQFQRGIRPLSGTGTREEPLRTSQERLRGRLTSPLLQKKSGEETLFSSPDFSEGWGMSVHRLIHEQYSAVTVSGQSVDSGYLRGWAIPVTERKLVVAIQSRFDTSVFDTNSRSETAQKHRSL